MGQAFQPAMNRTSRIGRLRSLPHIFSSNLLENENASGSVVGRDLSK